MDEDRYCNFRISLLGDATKACSKFPGGCEYRGKSTVRVYKERLVGVYKECLMSLFLFSFLSGNVPATIVLGKKLLLAQFIELN